MHSVFVDRRNQRSWEAAKKRYLQFMLNKTRTKRNSRHYALYADALLRIAGHVKLMFVQLAWVVLVFTIGFFLWKIISQFAKFGSYIIFQVTDDEGKAAFAGYTVRLLGISAALWFAFSSLGLSETDNRLVTWLIAIVTSSLLSTGGLVLTGVFAYFNLSLSDKIPNMTVVELSRSLPEGPVVLLRKNPDHMIFIDKQNRLLKVPNTMAQTALVMFDDVNQNVLDKLDIDSNSFRTAKEKLRSTYSSMIGSLYPQFDAQEETPLEEMEELGRETQSGLAHILHGFEDA